MLLNFNRLAKFAFAIFLFPFLITLSWQVLKFIFWYFCNFAEFMKYNYFILTTVISDLLSKSKTCQGLF